MAIGRGYTARWVGKIYSKECSLLPGSAREWGVSFLQYFLLGLETADSDLGISSTKDKTSKKNDI